jgi:hypothetical protein
LLITFRATFFYNTAPRDAGFPGNSSDGLDNPNYMGRAFVGPTGSYEYTEPLDRYAPVAYLVMDYPGGDVSWDIGTETLEYQDPSSGFWSYGLSKLSLEIKLVKV